MKTSTRNRFWSFGVHSYTFRTKASWFWEHFWTHLRKSWNIFRIQKQHLLISIFILRVSRMSSLLYFVAKQRKSRFACSIVISSPSTLHVDCNILWIYLISISITSLRCLSDLSTFRIPLLPINVLIFWLFAMQRKASLKTIEPEKPKHGKLTPLKKHEDLPEIEDYEPTELEKFEKPEFEKTAKPKKVRESKQQQIKNKPVRRRWKQFKQMCEQCEAQWRPIGSTKWQYATRIVQIKLTLSLNTENKWRQKRVAFWNWW